MTSLPQHRTSVLQPERSPKGKSTLGSKWGLKEWEKPSGFNLFPQVKEVIGGSTAHGIKYVTLTRPGKWISFVVWIIAVAAGFTVSLLYINLLLGESYIIVENGDISTGLHDIQARTSLNTYV